MLVSAWGVARCARSSPSLSSILVMRAAIASCWRRCNWRPPASYLSHCLTTLTQIPTPVQLYEVGDKRELLVTAHLEDPSNPDSTVTVDMTTTLPEGGESPLCAGLKQVDAAWSRLGVKAVGMITTPRP